MVSIRKACVLAAAVGFAFIGSNLPSPVGAQQRQVEPPIEGPGCPRLGTRSPRSNQRASVNFFNGQHREAHIYWVDFNGSAVLYATLRRGQSYKVNSFVGHVWVILNESGRCVSNFPIAPGGGEISI